MAKKPDPAELVSIKELLMANSIQIDALPVSLKYRYVPYAVRCLEGGSGIFMLMFADALVAGELIDHHFGLTH
jgi:hypothetical protein